MSDTGIPVRPPEGEPAPSPAPRRRLPPIARAALWLLLALLGLPLLFAAASIAIAAVSREDPSRFIPEGFDLYASVPSASRFTAEALRLKVLDAALSGNAALRGSVRALRSSPILRSSLYMRVADSRVDAALYPDGSFAAAADLGLYSAATRLAPFFGKRILGRLYKLEGLSWSEEGGLPRFEYEAGGTILYAATRKNLVLVASSLGRLAKALEGQSPAPDVARALAKRGQGSLRVLVDPRRFAQSLAGGKGPGAAAVSALDFPARSVVDVVLKPDEMSLSMEMPAVSRDPGLASIMARRSGTPSILSRLPESTEYFSLLAAGSPAELWKALAPLFGEGVEKDRAQAEKASRLLFGTGLDELLLSWIGGELGAFGSSHGPSPLFFLRVGDEKARRAAFEAMFASIALGQDLSVTVEGQRIPRISIPPFLSSLLEGMGLNMIEPFYIIEDGFLYASASAETLAACAAELRARKLLVKTPRWSSIAKGVSARSSLMIYYDLDRSLPFFLRGSGGLVDALKLFEGGAASASFADGALRLELAATNEGAGLRGGSPESRAARIAELPGFPVKAGGRMDSDPLVGLSQGGAPMAYWTSGREVQGLDLSSGKRYSLSMDDEGYAVPALGKDGRILRLWALSKRGSAYLCDASLAVAEGFPILTGESPSAPPSTLDGLLLAPVGGGEPALLAFSPEGEAKRSDTLHAPVLAGLAASAEALALLPRSFDSMLYLLSPDGRTLPGWPVALGGIAAARPCLLPSASGLRVAALDESGELSAFDLAGIPLPGFPLILPGVFDCDPAWAPGLSSIAVASTEGGVWLVDAEGRIGAQAGVKGTAGRKLALRLFDLDGDGREEIFLGGGGNSLAGLDEDLSPLPGFPLAASGAASFLDADGDGEVELVARGADDTIHAYLIPRGAGR